MLAFATDAQTNEAIMRRFMKNIERIRVHQYTNHSYLQGQAKIWANKLYKMKSQKRRLFFLEQSQKNQISEKSWTFHH